MKAKFFIIPLLLLAACEQMEVEAPSPTGRTQNTVDSVYTLTVVATKGTDTKSLWLDNSGTKDALKAYWTTNEEVQVLRGGVSIGTLKATPVGTDHPTKATLSGDLKTGTSLAVNDELTLFLPRETWNYTGQTGALTGTGSIEDTYDYATATVKVKSISDGTVSTDTEANFKNQQNVYRFSFKVTSTMIKVKEIKISAANNMLVQSRSFGSTDWTSTYGSLVVKPGTATTDPAYVSIRNESTAEDTYSFIITGQVEEGKEDALFLASQTIPASALASNGKFLNGIDIQATQPDFGPDQSANPPTISLPEKVF